MVVEIHSRASTYETEEVYSGLRAQDLQEAKDQGAISQNFDNCSKRLDHNTSFLSICLAF